MDAEIYAKKNLKKEKFVTKYGEVVIPSVSLKKFAPKTHNYAHRFWKQRWASLVIGSGIALVGVAIVASNIEKLKDQAERYAITLIPFEGRSETILIPAIQLSEYKDILWAKVFEIVLIGASTSLSSMASAAFPWLTTKQTLISLLTTNKIIKDRLNEVDGGKAFYYSVKIRKASGVGKRRFRFDDTELVITPFTPTRFLLK